MKTTDARSRRDAAVFRLFAGLAILAAVILKAGFWLAASLSELLTP